MKIKPGSFLLTSCVGGTDTNWRNQLLGKLIIEFQKLGELDGEAKFSHAEILVDDKGSTFAARWRTRERGPAKGLDAYKGSMVMIVEPVDDDYWVSFPLAYNALKDKFDGDIYPVSRLLMQGVSKVALPWIVKINLFGRGICSEVAGYLGHMTNLFGFWEGMTPAILEDQFRLRPSFFKIVYEGVFPGVDEYSKIECIHKEPDLKENATKIEKKIAMWSKVENPPSRWWGLYSKFMAKKGW